MYLISQNKSPNLIRPNLFFKLFPAISGVRHKRLLSSQKSLTMPIEELVSMGDKSGATIVHKAFLKTLSSIKKEIEQIDKDLDDIIKDDHQLNELYKLATSVPGVVKINAFMICFTNEFCIYTNPKQLACHCGVAPSEHSSRPSIRGRTRVSHMANKVLKRMLHMGVMSVIGRDPELRTYYLRKT